MNCQHCGSELSSGAAFCEHCGQAVAAVPAELPEKKENVVLGILGALIGAILGGASIILLSQLGYIASVSGLILAFCTLKGYELLGKKLSAVGIAFSIVLMIVMPYFADRLDWAIVIMQSWGDIGLLDAFMYVPLLIEEEAIAMADYIKNLGMIYLFVALGGVGTIIKALKKTK